jgi:dGTPase
MIKLVQDSIDTQKYKLLTTKEDRISYLRALAIGNLIQDAVKIFLENESSILSGDFPFALMDKSQYKAQMNDIIQISVKNIYQSREVVEKEIKGYQVINRLLDVFITAYNHQFEGKMTNFDQLVLKLLPEKYQIQKENLYERLMHISHFVSLLTDGKAMELNHILSSQER